MSPDKEKNDENKSKPEATETTEKIKSEATETTEKIKSEATKQLKKSNPKQNL